MVIRELTYFVCKRILIFLSETLSRKIHKPSRLVVALMILIMKIMHGLLVDSVMMKIMMTNLLDNMVDNLYIRLQSIVTV